MKKIIALILAAMMLLTFAACASKTTSSCVERNLRTLIQSC